MERFHLSFEGERTAKWYFGIRVYIPEGGRPNDTHFVKLQHPYAGLT